MRNHRRAARAGTAAGLLLAVTLGACSSPTPAGPTTTPPAGRPTQATQAPAATGPTATRPLPGNTYVSIGDSYAAGYQPIDATHGATTRNGFAYQVVTKARAKGENLTLANFGCSGATSSSVLDSPGCARTSEGPGAPSYTQPQAAAAENYIRAHRADVGLVTVSIGGNDITACATAANPTTCVTTALDKVKTNLATLLQGLRAAAQPSTRIVGITYPDVFLAGLVRPEPQAQALARISVLAFQDLVNPALQSTYAAAGAQFVDVTRATGAYGPLTDTTTLAPYGVIPAPVAKVCRLTYACRLPDIHPTTAGYAVIAGLVVATLPAG